MCGITGIISKDGNAIDVRSLVTMNDVLNHRGPDGEGFLFSNSVELCGQLKIERPNATISSLEHGQSFGFGHRRLSILDLHASASQPMTETGQRYWIVFNGEIYNHAELRKTLTSKGYQFLTDHSDTEVILNAYAEWGNDCLEHFNGMWAFCIWDSVENTFFLSRDRAGKKPLYYAVSNGQFYFASELKALLTVDTISREQDPRAIYDFLTYQMVPSPRTIFKNIFKLPAAHYIKFQLGEKIVLKKYWKPLQNQNYLQESESKIIEGLRERLYESARLRMLADVEVGVLLSGGVDSSVNLACLTKYANKPIKAFSVGFENNAGYKNEFYYAQKVAKHLGADYHELTLSKKDFFDFLPKMVYYQDEPIADPANIPIYYISKVAAAQGVKVLLGGEGSDELFVGYEHWQLAKQFATTFENRPKAASLVSFLHKNGPFKNKRQYYLGLYEKILNSQPAFWSGSELRSESDKKKILSEEFLEKLGNYNSFQSVSELYSDFKDTEGRDAYDWMAVTDLQYRLPDLLLARLDRMMMAASVEGRNPFLDKNVIEYALRIPPELRTKNKESKYILKKAFEGILPNEILYRKKDSFTVPLSQLFKSEPYFSESINAVEQFNSREKIFNIDYLHHLRTKASAIEFWNITNLAMWHNNIH